MAERIGVLGAGSWGTALAIVLAEQGHDVVMWTRRPEAAAFMQSARHNPTYLPGAHLPEGLTVTSDLEEAAADRRVWIVATPSQAVRQTAERVAGLAQPGQLVVSVAKGIERGTLLTTTQVLDDVLDVPQQGLGVLYGPSHAEEVAGGKPTTVVAAAYERDVVHHIQDLFMTPRLRVYLNYDVVGVEIGGSVKNVMAIAAGMSDGLGYGDNAKAAIVARGMAEIRRLGLAMGADASTFAGLAGIGDLVVTAFSRHSRNRHLGEEVGKGKSLEEVVAGMTMVAEGVETTRSVHQLAERHGIDMPITRAVYQILFERKTAREAVDELMTRSAKQEDWLPDILDD